MGIRLVGGIHRLPVGQVDEFDQLLAEDRFDEEMLEARLKRTLALLRVTIATDGNQPGF
jgi:hypothetical protein